jgi:DNA-binding NarL/FixJ family response regulator
VSPPVHWMVPLARQGYPPLVADIIVVSDAPWVRADVIGALDDDTIRELSSGDAVSPAVRDRPPDLVITDLQVGTMGAMAITMDLRLEESAGRMPHVPVLMLLDRRADVFLAKRSSANGWVVKPLDPIRLRKAVRAVIGGGSFHDESYRPVTVEVPRPAAEIAEPAQ